MPTLPREAEKPADSRADERSDNGGLGDDEHEVPESTRGVEAPNAAHNEQPGSGALYERGEDSEAYRAARREVAATGTIV